MKNSIIVILFLFLTTVSCISSRSTVQGETAVTASLVGMVNGRADAAVLNTKILASVLSHKQDLVLDGSFYISRNPQLSIDYPFEISGGELIISGTAFRFEKGGSFVAKGTKFTNLTPGVSGAFLFNSQNMNYQIEDFSLFGCTFNNVRICRLTFADLDARNDKIGFGSFRIENCNVNVKGTCALICDSFIRDSVLIYHNKVENLYGAFFYMCTTNENRYHNDKFNGPVIITNNAFTGSPVDFNGYHCAVLVESKYVEFANNSIDGIINYSDSSDATCYDAYLSCNYVDFHDNVIKNVMSFTKNGGKKPQCEICKAKGKVTGDIPAVRKIYNNKWIFDAQYFQRQGAKKEDLWANLFGYWTKLDTVVFKGNVINYKGAILHGRDASFEVGYMDVSDNVFNVDSFTGHLVKFRNRAEAIIINNNIFNTESTVAISLLDQLPMEKKSVEDCKRIEITGNKASKAGFIWQPAATEELTIKRNEMNSEFSAPYNLYVNVLAGWMDVDAVMQKNNEMTINKTTFTSRTRGTYRLSSSSIGKSGMQYVYTMDTPSEVDLIIKYKAGKTTNVFLANIFSNGKRIEYFTYTGGRKTYPGNDINWYTFFNNQGVQVKARISGTSLTIICDKPKQTTKGLPCFEINTTIR